MSVIYRAYAHEGVLLIFARREEALAIYGSITVAEIVIEKSGDARILCVAAFGFMSSKRYRLITGWSLIPHR